MHLVPVRGPASASSARPGRSRRWRSAPRPRLASAATCATASRDRVRVGDVALHREQIGRCAAGVMGDRHAMPGGGEAAGDPEPDAAVAAGHQHRAAGGRGHSGMFPCSAARAAARPRAPRSPRRGSCPGAMISSTRPSSTARPTPPDSTSWAAASSASSAGALLLRDRGELPPLQHPHRRDRAHDGDLGARPGEDPRGVERAGVHRDVGAAVGLAGHDGHPRHRGLGERVQQLGAAAYDAVPLLGDTGQIAGHVDEHDERHRRTRRTSARSAPPSPRWPRRGSRRAASGCWRGRRPSRRRGDRAW